MVLKGLQVYLAVCAHNPLASLLDTIPVFLDHIPASDLSFADLPDGCIVNWYVIVIS
jgi:hypothetical protein